MSLAVLHKSRTSRGVFYVKNQKHVLSELTYWKKDKVITIDYTETKRKEEGKGLATQLVSSIVEFARKNEFKIHPLCPFCEVQFEQNPQYSDVLV